MSSLKGHPTDEHRRRSERHRGVKRCKLCAGRTDGGKRLCAECLAKERWGMLVKPPQPEKPA
jgi:hypothetical protein